MTIGKLEIFLMLVLIAGSAWMGAQYLPLGGGIGSCTPIPLTPEVKAYVDAKIAAGNGPQCGEIPKVISRVAELEGRMGDLEKYRKMREEVEEKRQELEQAIAEQRMEQNQVLAKVRAAEVDNLKKEVGRICAGITVHSVEESSMAPGPKAKEGPAGESRRERRLRLRQERQQGGSAPAPSASGGGSGQAK